jgi:hypothetical protein
MLSQTAMPKFKLGRIVATPAALSALEESGQQPDIFLRRHLCGDWGDTCADDKKANDQALIDGTRLLSSYSTAKGECIWVITEADRSSTTILLPDDY